MRFSRRTFTLSAASAPLVFHGSAISQNATPTPSEFKAPGDRMSQLLKYVPGGTLDGELYLVWNDYERNVAALRAYGGDAAAQETNDQLALMSLYANGPDFLSIAADLLEVAGFTMGQVLQSLNFGEPPNLSLLIKLNENPETLIPFWESVEYEERENDFGTFWTIGEDGDMDLQHPVQRVLLAHFNNVAILPDNTLAYATTSELLGNMMSTVAEGTPNRIAELEPVIAELPVNATNAWFGNGDIFELRDLAAQDVMSAEVFARIEDMIADSDNAAGVMPVIRTFCVGITAGGSFNEDLHNSDARDFIILETDEADMAEQAAKAIRWRAENMESLNTGQPYSELLSNMDVEVLNGEFLCASLPLEVPRSMLTQMIVSRDILLFAY